MSIDASWEAQAVTALDVSAMAAAERIAAANIDHDRSPAAWSDDVVGPQISPFSDGKELVIGGGGTDAGPTGGAPDERVVSGPEDVDRTAVGEAATAPGGPVDALRENSVLGQIDQSYSDNLQAHEYAERSTGRIVDYTA